MNTPEQSGVRRKRRVGRRRSSDIPKRKKPRPGARSKLLSGDELVIFYLKWLKRDKPKPGHRTFYRTYAWRELRVIVFSIYGRKCMSSGDRIYGRNCHCDHILPRSIHPKYELTLENMQVLSKKANKLKSNTDFTDFRSPPDIEKLNRFYQSVRNYCERNGLVDEIIPQLSEPQDVSSELHQAIGLAGAIQAQQQRTQSATDD